jgi:hypothetical protein
MLIDVMDEVRNLDDPQCMGILIDELRNLFVGQSFDLHWTRQSECPSEEGYLEIVSQSMLTPDYLSDLTLLDANTPFLETGGLFRLIARLMSHSASSLHDRYTFFTLSKF